LPHPLCVGKTKIQDHRSLSANVETGAWECHRCRATGKLTDFWVDQPRLTRRQRQAEARAQAFELTPRAPSISPGPAPQAPLQPATVPLWRMTWDRALAITDVRASSGIGYLAGRGIPIELASAAGVRFSPGWYREPAVLFAVSNYAGELVAVQGRAIRGDNRKAGGPKGQGAFATPGAFDTDPVVIVEAPIDALTLWLCGVPAIAMCGKTAPGWLAKALAFQRVALAVDNDAGGDEATERSHADLTAFGCQVERWRPQFKDWNEDLNKLGLVAIRRALGHEGPPTALADAPVRLELGHLGCDFRWPGIVGVVEPGVEAWAVLIDSRPAELVAKALGTLRSFAARY
jgi:hypothetical protein